MVKKIYILIILISFSSLVYSQNEEECCCNCEENLIIDYFDIEFPSSDKLIGVITDSLSEILNSKDTLNGVINFHYCINEDGTISEEKIVRGIRTDIDNKVLQALKNFKFDKPVICGGKPMAMCSGNSIRLEIPEKPKKWWHFIYKIF
ncbi:MAG: hypothetical protein LBL74_00915 [Bacteroidales bacterium]|jgi:hypothetical protein|nr:hypothetical protein [Bacteroidales bacterium]